MLDNNIKDFSNYITDSIKNYCDLYISTMPKKIYRKLRFNNKHYKRYYIIRNYFNDLLINPLVFKPFFERFKRIDD